MPAETMKRGFNHDLEVEMSLGEPLQNLIRLIQPSLNCDLSKAAMFLCGVQELNPAATLKSCVRDGSDGLVTVKLSVLVVSGKPPVINISDVLQAAQEQVVSSSESKRSPSPVPKEECNSENHMDVSRRQSGKKRPVEDNIEWDHSLSRQMLVNNAIPEVIRPKKSPIGLTTRIFSKESSGTIQLWQFLVELLLSGKHPEDLEWTGSEQEFRLLQPERVAELWGQCKKKSNMNYEKMSRALRYYYDGKILAKVPGKHFTYRFVCDLQELGQGIPKSFKQVVSEVSESDCPLDLSPGTSNPSSPMTPKSRNSESDASLEVPYPHQRKESKSAALDLRRLDVPHNLSQMAA